MRTDPEAPAGPALRIAGQVMGESLFGATRGERCRVEECRAACCSNGVWVDTGHATDVLAHAAQVQPFQDEDRRDPRTWFEGECEDDDFASGRGVGTASLPARDAPERDTCVFLRSDFRCSLHLATVAMGLPLPGLKPFDCATYPILRSQGQVVLDEWSPAELDGADCQRARPEPPRLPVLEVFAAELALVLGDDGLAVLRRTAEGRNGRSEP